MQTFDLTEDDHTWLDAILEACAHRPDAGPLAGVLAKAGDSVDLNLDQVATLRACVTWALADGDPDDFDFGIVREWAERLAESSDERILREAAEAHARGDMISDLQARVISSQWHGGQRSALCALSTSGATVADLRDLEPDPEDPDADPLEFGIVAEIERDIREHPAAPELPALLAYVRAKGPRGRQPGWSSLSW